MRCSRGIPAKGYELVAELVMSRTLGPPLALIVEGKEDHSLLNSRIHHGGLRILPAGSKTACVEAARAAENTEEWIRCLADRDFDHVINPEPPLPTNLVLTEHYDLQTDYVRAAKGMLRSVILELLDSQGTELFLSDPPDKWIQEIIRSAGLVGRLRFAVKQEAAGRFSTDGWPMTQLLDAGRQGREVEALADEATRRLKKEVTQSEISELLEASSYESQDWEFVNGHDLVSALLVTIKPYSHKNVSRDVVESVFRAKVEQNVLAQLPAMCTLESWARSNGQQFWSDVA